MDVVYFSSDLFSSVTGTSIVSLLENNKNVDSIRIFYIDDGISVEKRNQTISIVKSYGREIIFITAPTIDELFDFKFNSRYQLGHSYMRMGLGTILPKDIDKVLCLDSDTLVMGSLKELWNLDMGENILAGVSDCINVKAYSKKFLLAANDIYCNAGIFLINLKEWRRNEIEKKIRQVIRAQNGNVFFVEQTLMSSVCRGKILKLKPNYNCYTSMYCFSYKNVIRWRRPINYYTENEISDAKLNPIVVHFTRNFYMSSRPWVEGCEHPMKDVYRKYMLMTPWKDLWKNDMTIKKKLTKKLLHILPEWMLAYVIYIPYNVVRPNM